MSTTRPKINEETLYWVVKSDQMDTGDEIPYDKQSHSDFFVQTPFSKPPQTVEIKSVTMPNYAYNVYSRRNDEFVVNKFDDTAAYVRTPYAYNLPQLRYNSLEELYAEMETLCSGPYLNDKYESLDFDFSVRSDTKMEISPRVGKREFEQNYREHRSFASPVIAGNLIQPASILETLFATDQIKSWSIPWVGPTAHYAYLPTDSETILTALGETPTGIWYPAFNKVWAPSTDITYNGPLTDADCPITITSANNKLSIINFKQLSVPARMQILGTATIPTGVYERFDTDAENKMRDADVFSISGDDYLYPMLSEAIFYAFKALDLGYDCYALCCGRLSTDSPTIPIENLNSGSTGFRGRWVISFEKAVDPDFRINAGDTTPVLALGGERTFQLREQTFYYVSGSNKVRLGPFPASGTFTYSGIMYINTTPQVSYYQDIALLYEGSNYNTIDIVGNKTITLVGPGTINTLRTEIAAGMPSIVDYTAVVEVVDDVYIDIHFDSDLLPGVTYPFVVSFYDPATDLDNIDPTLLLASMLTSYSLGLNGQIYMHSSDKQSYISPNRVSPLDAYIYKDIRNRCVLQKGLVENTIELADGFYSKDEMITAFNDAITVIQAGATPFLGNAPVLEFNLTTGKFSITDASPTARYTFRFDSTDPTYDGTLHETLGFVGTHNLLDGTGIPTPLVPIVADSVPNFNQSVFFLLCNIVRGYRSIYDNPFISLPSTLATIEVNVGRGGIINMKGGTKDSSIFPVVKTLYNDNLRVYDNLVNFKLLNGRGIPFDTDSAEMSLVLEIKF